MTNDARLAINAAETACNVTLAALRARVESAAADIAMAEAFNTSSEGLDSAYDAAREAERTGTIEAFAARDAIVAANGGPVDPIADMIALGASLFA